MNQLHSAGIKQIRGDTLHTQQMVTALLPVAVGLQWDKRRGRVMLVRIWSTTVVGPAFAFVVACEFSSYTVWPVMQYLYKINTDILNSSKQSSKLNQKEVLPTCIAATVDKRSLDWSNNICSCVASFASSYTTELVPSTWINKTYENWEVNHTLSIHIYSETTRIWK
jgi:hypothetical protein